MRHKNNLASYNNLSDILKALNTNDHCDSVWVGKNYTKGQLIRDLGEVKEAIQTYEQTRWVKHQLEMFDKLGED